MEYLNIQTAKELVISRAAISKTTESIEKLISEGLAGGIEVLHFAKYLEELAKKIRASEIIREDYLSEIDKGIKEYRGAKVEKTETGVKYDFSNSEAWQKQKAKVEAETIRLKEIEKQCKATTKPFSPLDPETGELLPNIAPPIKRSTTSPKITMP